ncbi:hypothetical protein PNH50_02580 [Leisingera aquaemixtae]|jgi:hypothetical protein|uniref:Uncharacterized protein n=1 Tax=Leisingera aquaemixtae TaxID=1396826 RepID=A0ABY5WKP7_9RHOB|nr:MULTISPECIES: hypothetical protein [Leisingera]QDI76910.1 hypothetical protein R2C4_14540 [Leisingera aquaemixtae]UWQ37915.1 hypothetical protein K3552_02575 [Leisingera aquaemixtae]UWQ42035.1 hypothetical protein K3718_02785 [Leisingera aquaemixtae]UWQ46322.1 hypothetical protein K3719_02875 [Leisingera aquaemixtae]
MEQCYQPEMGQMAAAQAAEPSDTEILAAVRRVLTAEVVEHTGYAQAPARGGWFAGSLAARLVGRFRG